MNNKLKHTTHMKKLLTTITLLITLLLTSASVKHDGKEPVTIFDSEVTAREFNYICQKENVPMELEEWIWNRVYIDYEKKLDQWIYIKGEDADSLFVLTRNEKQKLHLNIQTRIKPKK
jgi:hypothetical protein